MLPQDPYILFSYVNTKLRDQYSSLEALCDDLQTDVEALTQRLSAAGFQYDSARNQFV
ncbi:MAG TPA: DUF4250 domain-containing protein [Candidatus Flavonifractor merdigallinarum]|uniref:DUF4250 domain-containing protein n=1 Tax=Candidatus Flavonifractor merdigallinarum TaxID=2838589 RepID=A0A9D2BXD6_9FIRM|nr:DUF4250 domain-containing protein [Candidatus Flavonifractor merdigallinarum]